ncbi:hypothetical protein [Streptomyces sp. AP-93]|uniref:hypothetical protein n=1 Tax=Streptomyces sp. AP-93 TaxID=2929048 RepID=UPI001FAFEC81|nr:hypothetical protein [Streptomyces sp. AP-93]
MNTPVKAKDRLTEGSVSTVLSLPGQAPGTFQVCAVEALAEVRVPPPGAVLLGWFPAPVELLTSDSDALGHALWSAGGSVVRRYGS